MPVGVGAPWLAEGDASGRHGHLYLSPRERGSQAWLEYHLDSMWLWWTVLCLRAGTLPEALHWHLCSAISKPQKAAGSI